jgi:hypothetical protein
VIVGLSTTFEIAIGVVIGWIVLFGVIGLAALIYSMSSMSRRWF